jgi:hypothetical protein
MTSTAVDISATHSPSLPVLPKFVVTKDQQSLVTRGDIWTMRVSPDGGGWIEINFEPLIAKAGPSFVHICKCFIAWKAATSKAHTLANYVQALARVARYWSKEKSSDVNWSDIRLEDFQGFLSNGQARGVDYVGNDFSIARDLYKWACFVEEIEGFEPKVSLSLKRIRAPGNTKGQRVIRMDEELGPLIPEELELVNDAIKAGVGIPEQVVMAQFFSELGARPIQLLRCKRSGLKKFEVKIVEDGHAKALVRYTLEVPKAKDRSQHRIETTRPLSQLLGRRLEELQPLDGADPDAPLFWWLGKNATDFTVAAELQAWAVKAELVSPRTKRPLRLTPYRFRYSMGVEAARDGASDMQLADILDHTDTQNVKVYSDAAGTIMDLIEGKLDTALGSNLRSFLGRIADSDDQPSVVIPGVFPQLPDAPNLQMGVGSCGHNSLEYGLCKLAPPLTCYTCPKFAAFRQAPHRMILESLERMARTKFNGSADARISGELVRVIKALRELVAQLEGEDEGEDE